MKVISSVNEMLTIRKALKESVAFVPTMGALHEGHLKLVREAKSRNQIVIASIFVNPTQFNDPDDLKKYPRTIEADQVLLEREKVDYLFLPSFDDIYPDNYKFSVRESDLSLKYCGAHRPGHFDGVLTVVLKLFQILRPHQAFFGLKDYQQYTLIKEMNQAFFLDIDIIGVETVREEDGLAMSSRNRILSPENREKAPFLYQTIRDSKNAVEAKERLEALGFKVDYVEDIPGRRLAAVHLGNVRLIDNVEI